MIKDIKNTKHESALAVIKYGGHAMNDAELNQAFAKNILQAQNKGWKILIGHGGGPQINSLLSKLNIESSFKNGLRITSADTMKAVEMTLCGEVNTWLVSLLCENEVQAVGLSGKDCALLTAAKNVDTELEFVGSVEKVNPNLCIDLMGKNYVPVVAPIGYGPKGISLNINADTATGALAGALCADIFLLVTDVSGVLDKDKNRFAHLTKSQVESLIKDGTINGGMIPKVESCLHALSKGCKAAMIFDGSSAKELAHLLDILLHALNEKDFSTLTSGTVITA